MRTKKLNLLPLKALNVDDFFWNKYTGLVTKEIIPYQWKALNDEVADAEPSYCIDNFKVVDTIAWLCVSYFIIKCFPLVRDDFFSDKSGVFVPEKIINIKCF